MDKRVKPTNIFIASDSESNQSIPITTKQPIPTENPIEVLTDSDSQCSETIPITTEKVAVMKYCGNQKKHACYFCGILYPNIARHYERKHGREIDVAKVLAMPKSSKQRRKAWSILINKGDFGHNYEVLSNGKGVLIPKYCKNSKQDAKDFIPCQHCQAMYLRSDLWKHKNYCPVKKEGPMPRNQGIKRGMLLLPVKENDEGLHILFQSMKSDEITHIAKTDPLLRQYAKRLLEKHGKNGHQVNYISQKLREMGRLIIQAKNISPDVNEMIHCLDVTNYDIVTEAVRRVAGYNNDSKKYAIPSVALKIGHTLHKLAGLLKLDGIKERDETKINNAELFEKLYSLDWKESVSLKAHRTLEALKYNKPQLLPLVEDVMKLHNFLHCKSEEILTNATTNEYAELCKVTLTQIILFNRKRAGEAERIKVSDYLQAQENSVDPAVASSLTKFELELCNTHKRVEIVGKKERKVAVLLTEQVQNNISQILKLRESMNLQSDYLFNRPYPAINPYRGSDCLRQYAFACEAQKPLLMTSTRLRKQLATLSQVLNLSETSQDLLACFQGHDIRIHRQYYRLPQSTLEIAKVSRLLHCFNNGTLHKFKGMDLDDITFDEDADRVELDSSDELSGKHLLRFLFIMFHLNFLLLS